MVNVIQACLTHIGRKTHQVDLISAANSKALKKEEENLERAITNINGIVNTRFEVCDRALISYKSSITTKFNSVNEEMEAHKEVVNKQNVAVDGRFDRVEARCAALEAQHNITASKLDRILLLQGNILERMEVLEHRVQQVEQTTKVRDVEIAQALRTSTDALQEVQNSKSQTADSFTFLDEEVKYLKVFSRRINEDLKQFMHLYTDHSGKSKAVSKELKKRIQFISDVIDANVRGNPLPEVSMQICI